MLPPSPGAEDKTAPAAVINKVNPKRIPWYPKLPSALTLNKILAPVSNSKSFGVGEM